MGLPLISLLCPYKLFQKFFHPVNITFHDGEGFFHSLRAGQIDTSFLEYVQRIIR